MGAALTVTHRAPHRASRVVHVLSGQQQAGELRPSG